MDTEKTACFESSSVRPGLRAGRKAALMGAMLALSTGSADAVVFHDPIHTIQNVITQLWSEAQNAAKWGQDYAKQIQQTKQQLEDWQDRATQAMNFMDASMKMGADFKERSPSDIARIAKDRCPGSDDSGSVADLWKPFVPDMSGDIQEQQLEICKRIVFAESERFNEQVRMLKRISQSDTDLKKLAQARLAVGDSQGGLATNNNDLQRFSARASMDMQYTQTVLMTYDGYIASLKTDQQALAQQAMRGKRGNVWGSVVQGAALKTALEIQE